MNGKLQQPQCLWECMMMHSFDEVESFIDELGFDYKEKQINGLLYSAIGEVLILGFEENTINMVTYKTTFETYYTACVDYAMRDLNYKIMIDEPNNRDHVLRLEGETLTLFCLKMIANELN
ncbi:MAG: hypothetical protein ABWZ79_19260 [Pedobacter agri]